MNSFKCQCLLFGRKYHLMLVSTRFVTLNCRAAVSNKTEIFKPTSCFIFVYKKKKLASYSLRSAAALRVGWQLGRPCQVSQVMMRSIDDALPPSHFIKRTVVPGGVASECDPASFCTASFCPGGQRTCPRWFPIQSEKTVIT